MHRLIRMLAFIFFMVLSMYGVLCILLYFSQDSLLFYTEYTKAYKNMSQYPTIEKLTLQTRDGTILTGWKKHMPHATKTVLSFGGNADDVRNTAIGWNFTGSSLVTFEYRGYGGSE